MDLRVKVRLLDVARHVISTTLLRKNRRDGSSLGSGRVRSGQLSKGASVPRLQEGSQVGVRVVCASTVRRGAAGLPASNGFDSDRDVGSNASAAHPTHRGRLPQHESDALER